MTGRAKVGRGQHLQINWRTRLERARLEADIAKSRQELRRYFPVAVEFVRANQTIPRFGHALTEESKG